MELTRRRFSQFAGLSAACAAIATTASPSAFGATTGKTVNLTDFGGSTSAADNTNAFYAAVTGAGAGGTINVGSGTWKFASTIGSNVPITVTGVAGSTTFDITGGAYGYAANPGADGTVINNITWKSSTGQGATSSYVHSGVDTVLNNCTFYVKGYYGNDPYSGSLTANNCTYIGDGTFINTPMAVNVSGSSTKFTANGCTVTGLYGGFQANGVDSLTVFNCTFDGQYFFASRSIFSSTVVSSTDTTVTAADAFTPHGNGATFAQDATIVAWEKTSSSVSLTPISGRPGWYTMSGLKPDARTMLSDGSKFGVITDVNYQQCRIPLWYDITTNYPVAAPGAVSGLTAEKPYIGRAPNGASGTTATVYAWHAGGLGLNQNPPAGARLQANHRGDYQCFATGGTNQMTVTYSTVYATWSDEISCIGGKSVLVAHCTTYDGQDVGITLERANTSCEAYNNVNHRAGTAGIYIGSSNAKIHNNQVFGANYTTNDDLSYAALTIQGADGAVVSNNEMYHEGAPKEHYAIYIEGRVGQDNTDYQHQLQPPFSTNVTLTGNTYHYYPQYDVNISGTHAQVSSATVWAKGTRPHTDAEATLAMLNES